MVRHALKILQQMSQNGQIRFKNLTTMYQTLKNIAHFHSIYVGDSVEVLSALIIVAESDK